MPDNNQQKMLENNVTVLSEDNLISHLQNRKAVDYFLSLSSPTETNSFNVSEEANAELHACC